FAKSAGFLQIGHDDVDSPDFEQAPESMGEVNVLTGTNWRAGRVGNDFVCINILCRYWFFQPHQVVGFKAFGYQLASNGVVAPVHIGTDVDVWTCRFARWRDLVLPPLPFRRACGPVVTVVSVGVVELIEVALYRSKAHILAPYRVVGKVFGRRK